MLEYLARHWWIFTVRGALAIIFGILALVWPAITLVVLAIVFGAYALADGIFATIGAVRATAGHRTPLVLEALVGIAFGVLTLAWPRATVLALALLVGAWAVITGVAGIAAAVRLRQQLQGEWLYILSGAVSVLFGVLVLFWPASGALAIAWLIGLYAIVFGILMIGASIRIRQIATRP